MARNGGRSRITMASAMNVEPQTTYTGTRASHTRTPYRAATGGSCLLRDHQLKSVSRVASSPQLIGPGRLQELPVEGTSQQGSSLESIDRVDARRTDVAAPATRLGASGPPVRDLDGLLRRVPGRPRR